MICSTFITPQQSYGQFNFTHLDSLRNNFPPDSTYSPNRMVVKFKPGTMDLDQLCFTYETVSENSKPSEKTLMSDAQYYNLRTYLAKQRFYVKDLLTDTLLANFLVTLGADTLSRLTFASPCVDTLSITRHGDTIPIQDHLYMVLHFKNDTSIIMATYVLNGFFNTKLDYALPDFIYELRERIPNDEHFGKQKAFRGDYTEVSEAWHNEVGDDRTIIAIIDDGIDFQHCEFLQQSLGKGKKVVFGWSYITGNNNIITTSDHGTKIAGIIGGLTNRENNCVTDQQGGISGVAGGWGKLGTPNSDDQGLGASLIGYKTDIRSSQLVAAIKDAVADVREGDSRYGQKATIINASWGFSIEADNRIAQLPLEDAINSAYEHNVLFVAAKANASNNLPDIPSGSDHNKVFAVSSSALYDYSNERHQLEINSQWGENIDILAPSPVWGSIATCPFNENDNVLYSTPMRNPNSIYHCPGQGTSFATPQVVGISGLLHANSLKTGWSLYPEDYEGILKVAAKDINHSPDYSEYYDEKSGWGLVNARNIFKKILTEKYELEHFTASSNTITEYGDFSDLMYIYFGNYNNDKFLPSGMYWAKRRKITYTVNHPTTWYDDNYEGVDYKIYVWGNGGSDHSKNGKKGLNLTNFNAANFQTGYTGVNSGYGNCEEWNMIHDFAHHGSNSHTFIFSNYQYEIQEYDPNTNSYVGRNIPENDMLAAHYSVFARPVITSINEIIDNKDYALYPTFVEDILYIKCKSQNVENQTITILNILGENLLEVKLSSGTNSLNVSNLPIGSYFIKFGNNSITIQKFIKIR